MSAHASVDDSDDELKNYRQLIRRKFGGYVLPNLTLEQRCEFANFYSKPKTSVLEIISLSICLKLL